MCKLIIVFIIFMLGLYYIFNFNKVESFQTAPPGKTDESKQYKCPNVLIQKGNKFYLHNNKVAKVPGVNPLTFDSLEDYTEFLDWQRGQGIECPVLYVRESYDAQGNRNYNARPSPTDLRGGLQNLILSTPTRKKMKLVDAGHNDPPYNTNSVPSYDQKNMYVGIKTPLDKMYSDDSEISPNPMDANWGGHKYTKKLLDNGYYNDQKVWAWH